MRAFKSAAAAVLSLVFAVSACGGTSGTPTSGPGATTPAGQPTAVGGGPTEAPDGGTGDACTVITIADIRTATGIDYPAGTVDADGTCTWELVSDGYSSVSLSIDSKTSFAATKAAFPAGTDETVSGHPAFALSGTILQAIFVDLGGSVLSVTISPSGEGAPAIVKKLAELAVANM